MMALAPARGAAPLRLLCLGAHCDDIEIGCGATVLDLIASGTPVEVAWCVVGSTPRRAEEARGCAAAFLAGAAAAHVDVQAFRDGHFPWQGSAIKDWFEALKRRPAPDVLFCHERDDRHQDHRVVNEMVWNTFRDHLVLEYETPKWDGGLGQPNVFVPLTARQAARKADVLLKSFPTQAGRDWFTRDTFLAMMRLRGVECRAPSGYAEAFHGRKLQFHP